MNYISIKKLWSNHELLNCSKIQEEILIRQIHCIVVSGNRLAGKLSNSCVTGILHEGFRPQTLQEFRKVGSAGVGWRDGEKMQTTVIE